MIKNKDREVYDMNRKEGTVRGVSINGLQTNKIKTAARRVSVSFAMGGCAYFAGLAELPFGARPFGVALLAAAGREAVFVYLGLIISAFASLEADEAIVYFAIYSALLLLRVFSRLFVELRGAEGIKMGVRSTVATAFREGVGLRVLSSAVFGLALGASMLFAGGLLYYDLFGLLIITLSAPLITFLLCGYIEGKKKRLEGRGGELLYDIGALALCAISVFGAREINIYGVSLSVAFALMITFFVTCRRGVGYGAICGIALGLCYMPIMAPLFVIAALCMGVLGRFSLPLACFTAFFASCAWAFYVLKMSALLGVFGGILSACLLYSVIYRMIYSNVGASTTNTSADEEAKAVKCRVMSESALDGVKLFEMNARTSAISDGLGRLSRLFEEIGHGGASAEDEKYCAEFYNDNFWNEVGAPEYRALSALLLKAVETNENEYLIERELSLRLCRTLTDLNLDIFGVLVYGVRKKTIYIKGKSRELLIKNARSIIEAVAPLLPFLVDRESFEVRRDGEEGGALFIFERERLSASVVRRRITARDESVCGDSVAVFKNKDDRFFAFISDGMGSGSSASAVSEVAVGFLGNMLSTGKLSGELIDMLNGFLCTRIQKNAAECSATLDLFELDLMNGHSVIYKCGAAPSYVYRRGRLFKLRSETMPVGILNEVDSKKVELELTRGDVVVMVSDGVTGEGGECPWLFDLLVQNLPNRSLERIAELIVKYAAAKGSVDDITVILVRVE